MSRSIDIYVIAHKPFDRVLPPEYKVLYVGASVNASVPRDRAGCLYDDAGDNISEKNPEYCELTGLYWMWKHAEADIVGLCHYRRFLSSTPFDKKLGHILRGDAIQRRLDNHDIILPNPLLQLQTNKDGYCQRHKKADYDLTRETIAQCTPEYIPAFDRVMDSRMLCKCNMFIASRQVMNDYCAWLFLIYAEMEKRIDFTGYDAYQRRMFGFMSERMFNVWIAHNRLRIDHAFLSNTENSVIDDLLHR